MRILRGIQTRRQKKERGTEREIWGVWGGAVIFGQAECWGFDSSLAGRLFVWLGPQAESHDEAPWRSSPAQRGSARRRHPSTHAGEIDHTEIREVNHKKITW